MEGRTFARQNPANICSTPIWCSALTHQHWECDKAEQGAKAIVLDNGRDYGGPMRNNFSVRLIAATLLLGIAIWSVFGPPKPGVTDKAFTVRAP
jgi:hypothetical protein